LPTFLLPKTAICGRLESVFVFKLRFSVKYPLIFYRLIIAFGAESFLTKVQKMFHTIKLLLIRIIFDFLLKIISHLFSNSKYNKTILFFKNYMNAIYRILRERIKTGLQRWNKYNYPRFVIRTYHLIEQKDN
jgi:hypothetical protein